MRLYQSVGLQTLVRKSGLLWLLPKRLRELEAMTPTIQPAFSEDLIEPRMSARGVQRYRVALLSGCAQDLIFSDVNRDTAEVLSRNGCEVITPPAQYCCGSLHAHNGEWELAKELARRQLEQIPPDQYDAIISNAAGCGSHLKHYATLLRDDPRYRDRAIAWDAKIKDIHEWLASIGLEPPHINPLSETVVTYHEACHLCHGQQITAQPRQVLKSIPKLRLVELPESTWCCGSAGIYNLIQPEMASTLLQRKVNHIKTTGAKVVATGNPGCLLQVMNGCRQAGIDIRVVHPVSLLAEAYRQEANSASTSS